MLAGHAPGTFSLRNGYGRGRGGTMGNGLGASAYVLMAEPGRFVVAVETMKEGSPVSVHTPQDQFRIDGEDRDLYPSLTFGDLFTKRPNVPRGPVPTMLPEHDDATAAVRWAMVIDTGACIGCNACGMWAGLLNRAVQMNETAWRRVRRECSTGRGHPPG